MSLESALDEERREVLKLLEQSQPRRQSRGSISLGTSSSSGPQGRNDSPITARPIRSMLDVDDEPPVATVTDAPPAKAPTQGQTIRSLLNISASPPPPPTTRSANTSPTDATYDNRHRHRASDASFHPPAAGPRLLRDRDKPAPISLPSPHADYSFSMTSSNQGMSLPKRVTQGGKKSSMIPSSMSRVMQDPGSLLGNERGRLAREGRGAAGHSGSRSPSTRFGRSQSPHTSMLNTNTMNLMPTPGKFISDAGEMVDMSHAYRRLSDAYLARSGGSLSTLPVRRGSDASKLDDERDISPGTTDRLHEDDHYSDDEDEQALESSDEGSGGDSGGEWNGNGTGRFRGRKSSVGDSEGETPAGLGRAKGPRKTLSLLAAAEEERQQVASSYRVRSLLPPVTVTSPSGERLSPRKPGVHPSTSFDQGSTPVTSDDEEGISDIRRAQRLHLNISNIQTTPESHRSIRTIVRGEFDKLMDEIEEGLRRARTYLVATDLSDQAAYALEWTIGTILRDGDTMLAVYAMDEEHSGSSKGGDGDGAVGIGEGASAVKDQAAIIGSLTSKLMSARNLSPLSATFNPASDQSNTSTSVSPDGRTISKSEQDLIRATEDITQRCVKLLRKTRLQVRIVVEVILCKSPKNLITEVIDFIDPTLVILGSRGRSALKGVLLGSFSNFLVTKSSVPVMVARKKLKKHSKYKKTVDVRLANNLTASVRSLAAAKID
ncbi:MAG: hypothetical protein M1816_002812 [Peltula sp. TS41687]|nr:MAG: hypothetical protein M1816_002812 [Peltula sp. TS41687]